MFFLLLLILLFSFIYMSLFSIFFCPTGQVKQLLRALFGFIGSSPNPWDKHFTATRAPRIYNLWLLSLPRQPFQVRTCLMDFFFWENTFSFKRCYSKMWARSAVLCVRRQQSQLSPPVWVSFQRLPTLSHNTLEKANALFVPLLTGEGTGTVKLQFCSRRQPWGGASGDEGGVGGMSQVSLSPAHLIHPHLLSQIYSPEIKCC